MKSLANPESALRKVTKDKATIKTWYVASKWYTVDLWVGKNFRKNSYKQC